MLTRSLIERVPLPLLRAVVRRAVIGVNYHCITSQAPPHLTGVLTCKTPEQFEDDLRYLKRHFNPVTYGQVVAHAERGDNLPPRAVLVSFDDGFTECYTVARELLRRHEVPCVFFVTTAALDNRMLPHRNRVGLCLDRVQRLEPAALRVAAEALSEEAGAPREPARFLPWLKSLTMRDEPAIEAACRTLEVDVPAYLASQRPFLTTEHVRAMVEEGFTVGAHSATHREPWLLAKEELEEEIAGSCRTVAAIARQDQVPFGFPFHCRDIDRGWLAELRRRNPHVGLVFDSCGLAVDAPFVVQRFTCDNPRGARPACSNLAYAVRRAYMGQLYKQLTGRGALAGPGSR